MRDPSQGLCDFLESSSLPFRTRRIISTGIFELDVSLGGWMHGGMLCVYGPESSGKTTLALRTVAEYQRAGLKCLYLDCDYSLDVGWARAQGVDPDMLLFGQDNSEEVLERARKGRPCLDLVVVDSVPNIIVNAHRYGTTSGMLLHWLSLLEREPLQGGATVLWVDQVRERHGETQVSPEYFTGRTPFWIRCPQIVRLEAGEAQEEGQEIRFQIRKNRISCDGGGSFFISWKG